MPAEEYRSEIKDSLPDVETDRLCLRRFREGDAELLQPVFAKPQVWMYPYGRGFSKEETDKFVSAQVREWDAHGFGCWLALTKDAHRAIGYVGISIPLFLPEILPAIEVGWRFDPDCWGQGLATEGASAALGEAFSTLGQDRVCSAPQVDNPPSRRVCERLGMTFERIATAPATSQRGPVDVALYWITRQGWRSGPSSDLRYDRTAAASP